MQPNTDPALHPGAIALGSVDARAAFIQRVYVHLFGAILAFVALEWAWFASGVAAPIANALLSVGPLVWIGGFMLISWLASRTAHQARGALAYAALGGYVALWSVMFVPALFIAEASAPGAISNAASVTLIGFVGLTAIAIVTKRDFSFLRGILMFGGFAALGLIGASLLFGFSLGILFPIGMIALMGASILYETSNVLHHYPEDAHVGAALELFGSVALMFWYVLQLFLSRD